LILYEHVILFILSKANQRVHGIFKSGLRHFGLTPVHALILHALYQEDGISAGEIGRRLSLDSATLSGVLERMAEGGWIVKLTDEDDRRMLHIKLTPKAQASKKAFLKEVEAIDSSITATLRREERLLLERLLKELK
jgi:DNA-binding MarR family transcriptional regulator